VNIRPKTDADLKWVRSLLQGRWGSVEVVSRYHIHHADMLPGFIAIDNDQPAGLITYKLGNVDCEIVSLDSLDIGTGIGTALVKAVVDKARENNSKRIWLITTNDNIDAMKFYQKVGFSFVAIHRNAIIESRKLKPIIPEVGHDGIPIKDEIEFELILQ